MTDFINRIEFSGQNESFDFECGGQAYRLASHKVSNPVGPWFIMALKAIASAQRDGRKGVPLVEVALIHPAIPKNFYASFHNAWIQVRKKSTTEIDDPRKPKRQRERVLHLSHLDSENSVKPEQRKRILKLLFPEPVWKRGQLLYNLGSKHTKIEGDTTLGTEVPNSLDLVGIGALNCDYIVPDSARSHASTDLQMEFVNCFGDWQGKDEQADDESYDSGSSMRVENELGFSQLLGRLRAEFFDPFYGGSAFNTLRTVSFLKQNLTLGFVGVAGAAELGMDFDSEFRKRSINGRFLWNTNERTGRCVSIVRNGERQLRVLPGANDCFADQAEADRERVVDYLCKTEWIHVSSFLDSRSTDVLASILAEVRELTRPRISVDPGLEWARSQSDSVLRILGLADVVFLNRREFEVLAGLPGTSKEEDMINAIRSKVGRIPLQVVLKHRSEIATWHPQGQHSEKEVHSVAPLDDGEIVDDTGAGDVFAGGYIASSLVHGASFQPKYGVQLGHALAREKIRDLGDARYEEFESIGKAHLGAADG